MAPLAVPPVFPALADLEAVRERLGTYPERTRLAYAADWLAFFGFLRDRHLADATQDDVVRFVSEGRSPGLQGRRLSALRAVFQHAGNGDAPRADPTLGLRAGGRNAEFRKFPSLSVPDVRSVVVAASRPRDRLAILLCYRGMKGSEVLRVQWEDMHPQSGPPALRVSGSHARVLPVDDELSRTISELRAVAGTPASGPVFVARRGGVVLTERSLSRLMARIGDRVGTRSISPGRLRNSFAQHAIAGGMLLEHVHRYLGNRTIKSTADQVPALERQHPKLSKARKAGTGIRRLVEASNSAPGEVADTGQPMSDHDFARYAARLARPTVAGQHDRIVLLGRLLAEVSRREVAGEPLPPGHDTLPMLVPFSADQVSLLADVLAAARQTMRERMAAPASSREAAFYAAQVPLLDGVAAVLRHFNAPGSETASGDTPEGTASEAS